MNNNIEIKTAQKPEEKKEKRKPHFKKNIIAKDTPRAIDNLSPAHKDFVKEYVKNMGNATKAYLSAYPHVKMTTAAANGSKLLCNAKIIDAIREEYELYFKNKDSDIEKSKTYQLIHSLGTTKISEIIDLEGQTLSVKSLEDIPESAIHAIKSIKRTERTTESGTDVNIEVTLYDKLSALKLRSQIQGLLKSDEDKQTIEIVIKPAERPE